MTRDLKLYFLLICLPAAVLTGLGVLFLCRQSATAALHEGEMRRARIENLAASLQDIVNESGRTGAVVRAALCRWEGGAGVRNPVGAFTWSPKDRLTWSTGFRDGQVCPFPAGVGARLGELSRWNEWTAVGKKRARRGLMEMGPATVLWGRVDQTAYGLVFERNPLVEETAHVDAWLVGGILVVLLACVLAAGAWLMGRAAVKARRDDETKTTFLSNCSHELKTPLAGIGIWIDLLRSGRLQTDAKHAHAYEVIARENARMVRLVGNLLDFSRLEQGRRRYRPACLDLVTLAEEVVELVRGDFPEHGVSVRAAGPCRAWADADAVKQVLVNLLGNAAKYAATAGRVEVVVEMSDGCSRLSVQDRGPGLSPGERAHVFDRFYRADDALNSRSAGLGLGLSISRALAQDMDGTLSVAARPGGGCIFTLELPLDDGGGALDGKRREESRK